MATTEQGPTVLTCVLQKIDGETSFGFSVSQTAGSPHLIVKTVKENAPASRGGLKQGDYLLAIDNESLYGKTVKNVGEIISRAIDGQLKIAYSRGSPDEGNKENDPASLLQSLQPSAIYAPAVVPASPTIETTNLEQNRSIPVATQPDPISIHHLKKWPGVGGFGFSIQQKSDGTKVIVKVEPHTPAFASGIRQNAVLCQVNNVNVRNKSYQDTVQIIKESGSEVSITVASVETLQWLNRIGKQLENSMAELQVNSHEAPPQPPVSEPPAPVSDTVVQSLASNASLPAPNAQTEQSLTQSSLQASLTPYEQSLPTSTISQSQPSPVAVAVAAAAADQRLSASINQSMTASINQSMSLAPSGDALTLYRCHVVKAAEVKGYGFGLKFEAPHDGFPGILRVSKVEANSPAFEAGLEAGLVVVKINGSFAFNKTVAEVKPWVSAIQNEVDFTVATQDTLTAAVQRHASDLETAANAFPVVQRERRLATDSTVNTFASLTVTSTLPQQSLPTPAPSMPQEPVSWPSELPPPRSCQLSKWPARFKGYGFHLQAERNRQGHYIGKLDSGSPAEHGGLVVNWRIVAVNDQNVLNEAHAMVVQKIQASGDTVNMLIASSEAVAFCEQNNITISKSMTETRVQNFQTPLSPPEPLSPVSPQDVPSPSQPQPEQLNASTPAKTELSQSMSPAPPTPPSPLPFSPQPDQNRIPAEPLSNSAAEDADLAYMKALRNAMGTRRLRDARRQPNRDIRQAFELANGL